MQHSCGLFDLDALFQRVMTMEDAQNLLQVSVIDGVVLDNLACCKRLVESPFAKYEFIAKEPSVTIQSQPETIDQKYPTLFDGSISNATMFILYDALCNKTKVTVALRDRNCKESLVRLTGDVQYFDKHFNLVILLLLSVGHGELH